MKNLFRLPAIILSLFLLTAAQCNKSTPLPEFYYRCKVDGQDYRPNGCTNCITCTILRDTILLLGANRGFESVNIGINDRETINNRDYILNETIGRQGGYDNSPLVDDIFKTDSIRTGKLQISSIDKSSKIISGTFSFQAYNPVQNKTINITEGKFRLPYSDY